MVSADELVRVSKASLGYKLIEGSESDFSEEEECRGRKRCRSGSFT